MRKRLRILMADDSEEDIFFVKRAMVKSGVGESFNAVHDGAEAVRYLRGEGEFEDRNRFPFPTVLLCDLKMPVMDGFEVLEWLRTHTDCKVIPTIIFSSSSIDEDVKRAYELGANAFIVKPHDLQVLVGYMELVCQFWKICAIPAAPIADKCR